MNGLEEFRKRERDRQDIIYLKEAYKIANKYSTYHSTHTGVVLVRDNTILSWGANHAPPGVVVTDEILASEYRYDYIGHAERDAIFKAARDGIALKGSTMYSPWFPCGPCARAIITAGIVELVTHKELQELSAKMDARWGESQKNAADMLRQAGVIHRDVSAKIGDDIPIRFKKRDYHL